jgi:sulfite exporter TauE/SafE
MTALVAAVFVASLLGSLHCAGMCGGFLAFAVGAGATPAPRRWRLQAAYHLGRLTTYTILGALAGGLGAAIDLGASAVGLQRAAAALAGAMMVTFGVVTILRLSGVRVPKLPLPLFLRKAVERGHRVAFRLSPARRALAVGLLTTLLPCGWLYAFAITAAGTANPVRGAATMAVFWLGTLPVMVSLGAGVQAAAGALGRRLPVVTCSVLVIVGLFTLAQRVVEPPALAQMSGAVPADDQAAVDRVNTLDSREMPCCQHKKSTP